MTMDFRSRSADVRREAADILWRFRSSRAARRAGSVSEGVEDPPDTAPRPGLPVSPATQDLIRAARQQPPSAPAQSAPEPDGATTPAGAADAAAQTGDAVASPEPDRLPGADTDARKDDAAGSPPAELRGVSDAQPSDAPVSQAPEPSAPRASAAADGLMPSWEPQHTPAATVAPDPVDPPTGGTTAVQPPVPGQGQARDLMDLPGVGAGLVWLLSRCGVHTLADLARADAARLEQDLGLVGQLLDLPSWIDLARQAVETGRNPAP